MIKIELMIVARLGIFSRFRRSFSSIDTIEWLVSKLRMWQWILMSRMMVRNRKMRVGSTEQGQIKAWKNVIKQNERIMITSGLNIIFNVYYLMVIQMFLVTFQTSINEIKYPQISISWHQNKNQMKNCHSTHDKSRSMIDPDGTHTKMSVLDLHKSS